MKHWKNKISFSVLLLISLQLYVCGVPQWAVTESGKKYLIEDKYQVLRHTISRFSYITIEFYFKYTWLEALHECAKRNLSLVSLDSYEKNQEFVKLMQKRFGKNICIRAKKVCVHNSRVILGGGRDLWIGGSVSTSDNNERKFVWASHGKTFDFSHWQEGEPNNLDGNQPCVHTWSISNDFRWADGQYYLKYGYICEETALLYKCWGSL